MPREEIAESAIVHIPIYTFKYNFQGRTYTALVEAATGRVLANIFPEKAEVPYQIVGGLAAATFLCLATFPVFGALVDNGEGTGGGLLLCVGVGIPAALVLFGLASWVASKV